MAWIELHQAVWTHRKSFELGALLGVDETYAAAHVIRLWSWALDNAPDGDLAALSDRAIAFGAGWRHEVGLFVSALMRAGWLDEDRAIHDWDEYAGRLIEKRKVDAARKRTARMSAGQPPDVRRTSNGTAPGLRRTVPNRTGPDTTPPYRTTTSPLPPPPQAEEGGRRHTKGRVRRRMVGDDEPPAQPAALCPAGCSTTNHGGAGGLVELAEHWTAGMGVTPGEGWERFAQRHGRWPHADETPEALVGTPAEEHRDAG